MFQVTVITTIEPKSHQNPLQNFNEIYLEIIGCDMMDKMSDFMKKPEKAGKFELSKMVDAIRTLIKQYDQVMRHPKLLDLMKSNQKFDLVVLGWFVNDFHLGIAGHFQCPTVLITTLPAVKPIRDLTGSPAAVAGTPNMPRPVNGVPMTFFQRVEQFLLYVFEFIVVIIINTFIQEPYYKEHFPASKNYPTFDEVKKNVSLVLIAHHFSQTTVPPYLPNMIEVGGLQIKTKPDPLPEARFIFSLQIKNQNLNRFQTF